MSSDDESSSAAESASPVLTHSGNAPPHARALGSALPAAAVSSAPLPAGSTGDNAGMAGVTSQITSGALVSCSAAPFAVRSTTCCPTDVALLSYFARYRTSTCEPIPNIISIIDAAKQADGTGGSYYSYHIVGAIPDAHQSPLEQQQQQQQQQPVHVTASSTMNSFQQLQSFQPRSASAMIDVPALSTTAGPNDGAGTSTETSTGRNAPIPRPANVIFDSKHRYSEFESLQRLLKVVYPYCVVPPIPEKHSIASYATKQGKAKDDIKTIEKRKRMLMSFLNRVARHPILGRDHSFHRFLAENNWGGVLATSGVAHLINKKKNALQKALEKQIPRTPDPHFIAAQDYTDKFSKHVSFTYAVHKKIYGHYQSLSNTLSELGHLYNSFSLSETALAPIIEKVGAAFDSNIQITANFVGKLEENVSDPLKEYTQFSKTITKLLRLRSRKQIECEHVVESLESKRAYLAQLEKTEAEAQRLAAVLNAEGTNAAPSVPVASRPPNHNLPQSTAQGILSTITSLIDGDPETTRRNNIAKTRERIAELEKERTILEREVKEMNEGVQRDLNRFQREKIRDLRALLLHYANAHQQYCEAAAKIWEEGNV